ncbi:phage distal tail protein [Allostreptomyces psammosilenae]|uniref:Siphovirus-type tail component C-terminal domain-containing protein n=1 Tax=Allostreptomyces psammosilenae TaxID=1892865 RepID=A0A852ZUK7_9ACTN|nr:phage tail domain-containing protein [Allostreptomyces psammosilenae]NYI05257.1 hypothetical protein [Allostreptomyces psammosilenae]
MATTSTPGGPTALRRPTTAAPGSLITRDGQVQFGPLLLGPGTPYDLSAEGLTGWIDLPALDTADVLRPWEHGAWPGDQWAQPRTVAGTVWLLPDAARAPNRVLDDLLLGTAARDTEEWLAVRLHGHTTAALARVRQRVLPADRAFATQGVGKVSLQWVCTDPRRYAPQPGFADTTLPVSGGGLEYPIGYPLGYGTPRSSGSVTAANDGNAHTHPVLTITGPVVRPSVFNHTTGMRLEYDITLTADETLTVDTAESTVVLGGGGSRLHTATPLSDPERLFTLAPGDNALDFRAPEGGEQARLSVTWRSAHL